MLGKLGGAALGIGGGAAGAAIGGMFARKADSRADSYSRGQFDHQMKAYQTMGLTPQEIVGAPSSAGGQGTTGSFGNMFDAGPLMQQRQMEYDAEQRGLDRKNALDIAEIQYGTGSPADRTADAAISRVGLEKMRLEFEQMHKNREFKIALERHKREQSTKSADFLIFMALLTMGPDNLRTSVVAVQLRKLGYEILDEKGELIPEKEFNKIMQMLRKESSSTYREIMGTLTAAFDLQGAVDLPQSKQPLGDFHKLDKFKLRDKVLGNKNRYNPGTPIPLQ